MNTCQVEGCDRPRYQRRLICSLHHGRRARYGDEHTQPPDQQSTALLGRRIGTLTVLRREPPVWICTCDCGAEVGRHTHQLRVRGVEQDASCGDRRRHRRTTSAGYRAAHDRVRRDRGSAARQHCVDCGQSARQWSYDHDDPEQLTEAGLPYSLDPVHYAPRCVPCHKRFDLTRA